MRKPGFMISLATITAMYTEHSLSKGPVRTSNWEVQPLRENQLECEPFASSLPFFHCFCRSALDINGASTDLILTDAANDAHCALMVYNTLIEMAKKAGVQLDTSRFTQHVKFVYNAKPTNAPKSDPSRTGSTSSSDSVSAESSWTTQSLPTNSEQGANTKASVNKVPMSKPKNVQQKDPASKPVPGAVHQRPQHIRAYNLWQHKQAPIPEMCATLRSADNPLKVGTVM